MRYGSVCSGIEAATVAWHSLGWVPSFFSEIEKFPREVLAHHYPDVPLHGDFTTIGDEYGSIDLLVGGTPCQSFSIAGLRKGLDDDRGNLALEFIRLAQRTRPRWVVWENVPGVLSSNGGRDFGTFLGALGEIGYGFAYRILDAQYFGVAQRRRRVFVVGYLGDWRRAAAVLFERESLSGNPAPSRSAGKEAPRAVAGSAKVSSGVYEHHGQDSRTKELGEVCTTVTAKYGTGGNNMPIVTAGALCARTGRSISVQDAAQNHFVTARMRGFGDYDCDGTASTVKARDYKDVTDLVACKSMSVRRLTPIECERLQGFPDGYTEIKEKTPDGPRYKALGNSMAVPVMKWIGERIQKVDEL